MIDQAILEATTSFLEHLGLDEEPIGVYYDDTKPENAFGPKPGPPISRQQEDQGQIDMQLVFQHFSCVMGNIWLARKKKGTAYISTEEYGCPGGSFYCSMMKPNLRFIEHYVTTGFAGSPIHGERYLPSPKAMRKFLDTVNPRKAPGKYCLFKPLSLFSGSEEPDFVTFFARPEVVCGLFTHTTFTTGEVDSVVSPFGAGCTNVVAWPLYYQEKGLEKAVLGGFDPSARKYMKVDELTFTVSWSLYQKMLKALPESVFSVDGAWKTVRKKINRSAKKWGETR
ncbi:DUF169 domain-containing protein [Desulfofustis glycolicus]|uniref:Uncharacterized conserved protein, DUF169 family n=1 Tax=Desulfofustis glycolicus DSM 9705 TaxID=1121409 RepID=A0A1M5YPS6_9BACT|nr:DUF169 domain-containing protein [Desulfofustis glycolicus]SHI13878.1 Uncharacterized conserved protein, DUF169 family [Desulfofustis glycolicus DSM 9705]